MGKFSLAMLERQRRDAPPLAMLLRKARQQLGLNQMDLAKHLQVDPRTLSRWEAGDARPSAVWREHVAKTFERIDRETWRALVKELALPLDTMLDKCPSQRQPTAHVAPPVAPTTTVTKADARAQLDAIVRATAEELDVTAKRFRSALGNVLADIARLELSPLDARALVLHRSDSPTDAPRD